MSSVYLTGIALSVLVLFSVNVIAQSPTRPSGNYLDARSTSPKAAAHPAYSKLPLTAECWTKLSSQSDFNVILAYQSKESANHWELYSYAGSGAFSAYLPGYSPAEIVSTKSITDNRWHHVAMLFDGSIVTLYVDAQKVVEQKVSRLQNLKPIEGPLTFGYAQTQTGTIHCDGLIDEVRISNALRIPTPTSINAPDPDASTVGLWHFDSRRPNGKFTDSSTLNNPATYDVKPSVSLDEIDNASFKAGPKPMAAKPRLVKLEPGTTQPQQPRRTVKLDGPWQLAENGDETTRLNSEWSDAIPVQVPGSVHTALEKAGIIPDPKFGRNDQLAHDKSFSTWWYKTIFRRSQIQNANLLSFGGVANTCTVWLNGKLLGKHDGMFGGPSFDVAGLLQDSNTLIVKVNPAPGRKEDWDNPAWTQTVTFNNVYGWHYSSIPALGIWRSVTLEAVPEVAIEHPFVATKDAQKGIIDLAADMASRVGNWKGKVTGIIEPDNFKGQSFHFTTDIDQATKKLRLQFAIPNPKLWWPNDLGDPNLYRLKLSLVTDKGITDSKEVVFGIRTIEMAPLPGGPNPRKFNWTFVVNKRPIFVKGTGWCTMDSSMDFTRARYERLISFAKLQHIQMLRAWGSGMPETDEFYDLCNRNGIMVMQEWPTAWNSHRDQPYDALEETVRLNILRIRNNPSLAIYTGGNESGAPFGKAIDMMGRYTIELDGTRAFHRGEPWGGSAHNYNCYWGMAPLDHNLNMTAPFWGEFGLACMPALESVLRYLPSSEQDVWPPKADGSLVHHTPKFNTADDWNRIDNYSKMFSAGKTLGEFIVGSQLSQAVGVRHTLERARTRWPESTGALYYKMNDNYPAASWSCVDWYGAPKIGHYVFQQAFAPLHACLVPSSLDCFAGGFTGPLYLLDDANALSRSPWQVNVRVYGSRLQCVKKQTWQGTGSIERVRNLGLFSLSASETKSTPLLVVTEVIRNGALADRTFILLNFEQKQGCLFSLPTTSVTLTIKDGKAVLTNTGTVPAVGVSLVRPGHAHEFTAEAGFLWLEPGETRSLRVNSTDGLQVEGLNLSTAK